MHSPSSRPAAIEGKFLLPRLGHESLIFVTFFQKTTDSFVPQIHTSNLAEPHYGRKTSCSTLLVVLLSTFQVRKTILTSLSDIESSCILPSLRSCVKSALSWVE